MTTAAGLRHIAAPSPGSLSSVIATAPTAAAQTGVVGSDDDASSELLSVNETAQAPFEAPVLDPAKRLAAGQQADFVLTGGRIVDAETGFDRIGNVAVLAGAIVEISDQPIESARQIPVDGNVISAGFIDLLSYTPNGYGEWFKVADGVTSNISMHGLRFDPTSFYTRWETDGCPIHFGGAVHNSHVRNETAGFGPDDSADPTGISAIAAAAEAQVRAGYLGIHAQPEYAPGVEVQEMLEMGRVAARLDVPLTVHARYSDNLAPGLQSDATAELIEVARETGCHVHIEHLNSTGGTGRMAEALGQIEDGLAEGLRLTACMYPYEFWATTLKSARYRDWQEKFGLDYGDLQVAGTDVRLTSETFQAAFDENKLTAAFAIPAADIDLALKAPFMLIGSDAILERSHNNHPRSTGCFSRVLGHYVRDTNTIDIHAALAMMTIRPAQVLGLSSPAMRSKGRMQIGADADITVFDPLTITDASTIANPAIEAIGVNHVFVNGTEVRNTTGNLQSARPGTAIRSDRA